MTDPTGSWGDLGGGIVIFGGLGLAVWLDVVMERRRETKASRRIARAERARFAVQRRAEREQALRAPAKYPVEYDERRIIGPMRIQRLDADGNPTGPVIKGSRETVSRRPYPARGTVQNPCDPSPTPRVRP